MVSISRRSRRSSAASAGLGLLFVLGASACGSDQSDEVAASGAPGSEPSDSTVGEGRLPSAPEVAEFFDRYNSAQSADVDGLQSLDDLKGERVILGTIVGAKAGGSQEMRMASEHPNGIRLVDLFFTLSIELAADTGAEGPPAQMELQLGAWSGNEDFAPSMGQAEVDKLVQAAPIGADIVVAVSHSKIGFHPTHITDAIFIEAEGRLLSASTSQAEEAEGQDAEALFTRLSE